MKFLAYKIVETDNAAELAALMDAGFSVQRMRTVSAVAAPKKSDGAEKKRRRRRRRTPMKVTPALVKQMSELRAKGLTYRIIGKRFGVTDGRAWQIVNQWEKA